MTVVFKGIVAYNICRLIGRGHSSAQNGVRQESVHLEILSQLLFSIQSLGLLVAICTPSSHSPGAAVSCAFSLWWLLHAGEVSRQPGLQQPLVAFWENTATYPHKAKKGEGISNQSGGPKRREE